MVVVDDSGGVWMWWNDWRCVDMVMIDDGGGVWMLE